MAFALGARPERTRAASVTAVSKHGSLFEEHVKASRPDLARGRQYADRARNYNVADLSGENISADGNLSWGRSPVICHRQAAVSCRGRKGMASYLPVYNRKMLPRLLPSRDVDEKAAARFPKLVIRH